MRIARRKKILWALLLCAVLFLGGPVRPVIVSASNDDEIQGGEVIDENAGALEGAGDEVVEGGVTDDSGIEDEPATTASTNTYAGPDTSGLEAQIAELNDKIANLKNETKKLESEINSAKSEKEKAIATKNSLDYQISLTNDEINFLGQRIELLEQDIQLRTLSIEQKQAQIDYNYGLLTQRIRAQYMNDNGSMLGLLLTADSFSDFLSKSEYMVCIAQHDRDLMATLTEERESLEREMTELEKNKEQVELDKVDSEGKKQELGKQQSAAALLVQDYAEMEERFNADLEKNIAMQAQMKAEIDNIYKQIELSKNPYAGGEMAWPLPGYSQISSEFGPRFGGSDYHTGMDITGGGCHGATIVAANDGVVKFVNTSYTPGWGYGIYLIIDHGGNVSTLYAHCSGILVSLDQEVKRGEPIALVGNTGWSTGPHLHFEVRTGANSTPQNPRGYVMG